MLNTKPYEVSGQDNPGQSNGQVIIKKLEVGPILRIIRWWLRRQIKHKTYAC